jgi:hypothetical protein
VSAGAATGDGLASDWRLASSGQRSQMVKMVLVPIVTLSVGIDDSEWRPGS